jgi:two-component system CheB/CheR fusion protein
VLPVRANEGGDAACVVLFEECPRSAKAPTGARSEGRATRAQGTWRRALEDDLSATKEYVAVLLEEQGRATDALASANDELISGNEELQSLNEELETAKEELQATNEELTTVNDELTGRNQEVQAANADILNLLDAVELPILMLDAQRRIQRFTPLASTVMGLTPADVGRRVTEVALPILAPDLEQWIAKAMREAVLVEAEVQDRADRWHRLQVRPRRGPDGKIDGAILSLADIDELRHQVVDARVARDYARSIVEAVQVPLLVLDAGLHVLSANAAYHGAFPEIPVQIEGRDFFELSVGQWNTTELHRAVGGILATTGSFQGLELEWDDPGAGRRATSISGCAVPSLAGEAMVLLSIEDVTERRQDDRRRADLRAHGGAAP